MRHVVTDTVGTTYALNALSYVFQTANSSIGPTPSAQERSSEKRSSSPLVEDTTPGDRFTLKETEVVREENKRIVLTLSRRNL